MFTTRQAAKRATLKNIFAVENLKQNCLKTISSKKMRRKKAFPRAVVCRWILLSQKDFIVIFLQIAEIFLAKSLRRSPRQPCIAIIIIVRLNALWGPEIMQITTKKEKKTVNLLEDGGGKHLKKAAQALVKD